LFICPWPPDSVAREAYDARYMKKHGLTKENSVQFDWGLDADGYTATTEWKKKEVA
jgi:hypothetical protein